MKDPGLNLRHKIMTIRAYSLDYVNDPKPVREYLKYLKKEGRPYSDQDAIIAKKLAPIIKGLDVIMQKSSKSPSMKKEFNKKIDNLYTICQGASWDRFLNNRAKQIKKKEAEKNKKELEKLKSTIEKKENRLRISQVISDENNEAVEGILMSLNDFLAEAENATLPIKNKNDLVYLLTAIFHDLNPDNNGLIGLEIGPDEKESAHAWLKKLDKLFAQASRKISCVNTT